MTRKSSREQGFPLEAPWDQGQGVKGATETPEAYDRFEQFLELGPERTLTALARILGISHQAISQTAARINWKKRAEAYDRSKGRKGKPKRTAPPTPLAPKPPAPPRAPQSPSPASTVKVVNPEVLGQQQEGNAALDESHLQVLSRYRKAYDALGSGMAEEAQALFPLVRAFRSDLELARQIWRQLLEQQEIERAIMMARMLWDLIPAFYRLCEAMHGLANGGRTHWGDSAGVHRILEEAFAIKKGKQ
jgi:hypothetical protein